MIYLFVHGFKRVTDHGETLLVGGSIKKTLSKLDFGSMSDITNKTIKTLTKVGLEIVEICNHNHFCVTYTSIAALVLDSLSNHTSLSILFGLIYQLS